MQFFFTKKNIHSGIVILIVVIFVWIFISNILPRGYVVSATDHAFFLDMQSAFKTFFYTWTNGLGAGQGGTKFLQAAIPYYFILFAAKVFNIPDHILQSLMLPIFTFLSFLSFYFSLKILFPEKIKNNLNLLFSLVYGLNAYTLYLFIHVYGYFYQQVLYIFIPLLVAMSCRIIANKINSTKYFVYFALLSFLSSMGFNNPGFMVALNVVIFVIFLFDNIINFKTKDYNFKRKFFNYFAILIILFLTNAFWLFPYFSDLIRTTTITIGNNTIWNLESWIKWQSSTMLDVFKFGSGSQFVVNSIHSNWLKIGFVFLTFIYYISLFVGIIKTKKIRDKSVLIFGGLLVVLMAFSAKYHGPLGELSVKIFSFPVINSLRSYDKMAIFIPFVSLILIYSYFINNNYISKKIRYLVIILMLFLPVLFYSGKLQQNISSSFKNGENYLNAGYSFLVKVPQDYYDASKILNNISSYDFKIQYLPFGVINSPGWSQYPKWKFMGSDITTSLFDKPVQKPASYLYNQELNYGKLFNSYDNPEWILRMFGFMNDAFLVFNKDVDEKFLEQAEEKIANLERSESIIPIFKKDFIDLYKINKKYFLPHLYTPQYLFISLSNVDKISQIASLPEYDVRLAIYFKNQNIGKDNFLEQIKKSGNEQKNKMPVIEFKKIDPTKYRVMIHDASGKFPLVLSESFHDGWKIYLEKNKISNIKSQKLDGYRITHGDDEYKADENEIADYISKGWITTLGEVDRKKWENNNEKYNIDFISKNFQDTIQNDNLSKGHIWETWFRKPIENNANHLTVNGYANSWIIDVNKLCSENPDSCTKKADGTYDFEIVVEFWPQRLFYLGSIISGTTLIGCLGYLLYAFIRRKDNTPNNQ